MTLSLLIAQSDQSPTHYYRIFLSELGYEVRTAIGGLECLHELYWRKPDVLILEHDLNWGPSDGVLSRAREDEALRTPVVLVTREDEPPSRFMGEPVACCLRRPFSLMEMLDCIQQATVRKERLAPSHRALFGADYAVSRATPFLV